MTTTTQLPSAAEYVAAQAEKLLDELDRAGAPANRQHLDYSPESLVHLDALLGELHTHGVPAPEELLVGAASYLMEVGRREHGGAYLSFNDDDPLVLVVSHNKGQVGMLASSKVKGRVTKGTEDDLAFFYAGFSSAVREQRSATVC